MAQMDRIKNFVKTSREVDNEHHHHHGDEDRYWATPITPTLGKNHDQEEDHDHQTKKSVLAKVKEKARKWRNTLVKKKQGHDSTPEWGVSLDDIADDHEAPEDDSEYLGAPVYESEMTTGSNRDVPLQHPKMVSVTDKHVMVANASPSNKQDKELASTNLQIQKQVGSPSRLITEPVSSPKISAEKLHANSSKSITNPLASSNNFYEQNKESPNKYPTDLVSSINLDTQQKERPNGDDPDYLGAPVYGSEMAPGDYNNVPSQHTKLVPVTDKHVMVTGANPFNEEDNKHTVRHVNEQVTSTSLVKEKLNENARNPITDPVASINFFKQKNKDSPTKTTTDHVSSMSLHTLPHQHKVQPSQQIIEPVTSTIDSSTKPSPESVDSINFPTQQQKESSSLPTFESISRNQALPKQDEKDMPIPISTEPVSSISHPKQQERESPSKTITESVTEKLAPAYAMVSDATQAITTKIQNVAISASSTPTRTEETSSDGNKWDKGVSVREYLMHKLEPGEEERALSQVISEAMSPKKIAGDTGVVEKVRDAVSSMLGMEQQSPLPSTSTSTSTSTSITKKATNIPISTNAQEVAYEENKGRRLQTN